MESQITISGNVGAGVAFREVKGYGGAASFGLAHTPRVRREGKWEDGHTLWFQVRCWRALAEHVRDSVGRGDPVVVTGRLHAEIWYDRDGVERQELVIEARSVGHDLTRGTTEFARARRPQAVEPQQESDVEAELADWEAEMAQAEEPEFPEEPDTQESETEEIAPVTV